MLLVTLRKAFRETAREFSSGVPQRPPQKKQGDRQVNDRRDPPLTPQGPMEKLQGNVSRACVSSSDRNQGSCGGIRLFGRVPWRGAKTKRGVEGTKNALEGRLLYKGPLLGHTENG